MKLLFVIENFYPYQDASSKVLNNFLSSVKFKEHEVHVLAKQQEIKTDSGIVFHSVKPFKNSVVSKIINKLFNFRFFQDKRFIRSFKSSVIELQKENNFDRIIFVCGNFNLLYCSNCDIANITCVIYFDLFSDNYFYHKTKKSKLQKHEQNLLINFNKVFVFDEYFDSLRKVIGEEKIKRFNFPIIFTENNASATKKYCIQTGAFFLELREPGYYFDFCSKFYKLSSGVEFINLGLLPKKLSSLTIPKNVKFRERIFGDEYSSLVQQTRCLVAVDNYKNCMQIPSKLFEFIGLNKKILFFGYKDKKSYELIKNNGNVFFVNMDNHLNDEIIINFNKFLEKPIINQRKLYENYEFNKVASNFIAELEK